MDTNRHGENNGRVSPASNADGVSVESQKASQLFCFYLAEAFAVRHRWEVVAKHKAEIVLRAKQNDVEAASVDVTAFVSAVVWSDGTCELFRDLSVYVAADPADVDSPDKRAALLAYLLQSAYGKGRELVRFCEAPNAAEENPSACWHSSPDATPLQELGTDADEPPPPSRFN